MPRSIGFIGAGQMARALASGFIAAGKVSSGQLLAGDVSADARSAFAQATGGRTIENNLEVVTQSDVVVLSVKPQGMDAVLEQIRPALTEDHLVVSIVTGVALATMASRLGKDRRLVRVMPNTPCLVGASASGIAIGGTATAEDAAFVEELFRAVGVAIRLPETLLDAVTGLSGSGPAYVYLFIEALSDGGVRAGLPRDVALKLAAQTVFGAARMVLQTGLHPGQLKDMVTSPAGTTVEGLAVLERSAVRSAVIEAVTAAARRATELGRPAG